MKIECNEQQAFLIEVALDVLSRMTAGQLEEMIRGIECFRGGMLDLEWNQQSAMFAVVERLKQIMFPELPRNASYGVGQKEIGHAQVAYEMVKILQNFRSRNWPEDKRGVLAHEPLHYSKQPLIKVEE